MPAAIDCIGVVVIGRNEGERLLRCLASVQGNARCVVYVDSGSTDGSADMARTMGANIVDLELAIPFTAARARNEGFRRLRELAQETSYVQFVDGDCEVVAGWLETASTFLDAHPDVAAVCGRRRERFPERSIYNRMCDMEWDTPVGETRACGGDVLMRASALVAAGGYRADLIAGEEPELCVRLRAAGHRIWRLDAEMTLHDAAMTRFGQWWRRTTRGGHAFAEGAWLHGAPPERHWIRETARALLWGAALPSTILLLALFVTPWALALFVVYPVQVIRLALHGSRSTLDNWLQSFFLVLGKFPETIGVLKFYCGRLAGRRMRLIEYK